MLDETEVAELSEEAAGFLRRAVRVGKVCQTFGDHRSGTAYCFPNAESAHDIIPEEHHGFVYNLLHDEALFSSEMSGNAVVWRPTQATCELVATQLREHESAVGDYKVYA